jgi:hypothetical protein
LFKSLKPDETSSNKDYNFEEDTLNENKSADSIIQQKNDV